MASGAPAADGTAAPRVCLVANALGAGGVERQLVQTARVLRREGWPTSLIALEGCGSDVFAPELGRLVDELVLLGSETLSQVARARTLARTLARLNPNLSYSFTAKPNVLTALTGLPLPGRAGRAVVWGIRDSPGWRETEGLRRFRRAERLLSGLPQQIIFNSCAGQREYRQLGYRTHGTVVHNGIDTDYFRPRAQARVALRARLGLPASARVVGMAGRLHPKKGLPHFLEAARQLAASHPDVAWVHVGGDGSPVHSSPVHSSPVHSSPVHSSPVHFLGHSDDMPAVLGALDVFCLPSIYGEGFPNVVAEAMACGVPCVVTPVGDAAEIVADTGVVVAPGSGSELAAAVAALLARTATPAGREAAGQACRARVVDAFGLEAYQRNLVAVLRGVLGEPSGMAPASQQAPARPPRGGA